MRPTDAGHLADLLPAVASHPVTPMAHTLAEIAPRQFDGMPGGAGDSLDVASPTWTAHWIDLGGEG
jgi:hypothetical protein